MTTKRLEIDLETIASLARIALSDDEKRLYEKKLAAVLEHLNRLDEIDVEGVEPLTHPFDQKNLWEEDRVGEAFSVDAVLKNAPATRENMISVPTVVE